MLHSGTTKKTIGGVSCHLDKERAIDSLENATAIPYISNSFLAASDWHHTCVAHHYCCTWYSLASLSNGAASSGMGMGRTSSRGSRMRRLFARNTAGPPLYWPSPTGQHAAKRPEGSCTGAWRLPMPDTIIIGLGDDGNIIIDDVDVEETSSAAEGSALAIQPYTARKGSPRHRCCWVTIEQHGRCSKQSCEVRGGVCRCLADNFMMRRNRGRSELDYRITTKYCLL